MFNATPKASGRANARLWRRVKHARKQRVSSGSRILANSATLVSASAALILGGLVWFGACAAAGGQPAVNAPVPTGLVQVELVDQHIRQGWVDAGFRPSAAATNGEWCRRVFLDLVGRIPTLDELQVFLKNRSPRKKAELVDLLLEESYGVEFARHWATLWTNLLIGRSGGTQRDSLESREGMQQYLYAAFLENKPYDRLVHELITATGGTQPGSEDFNGATNYLAMKLADRAALATAKTAQIFLNQQVQCTQCHDHPFNEWKQNQFWELNAFFRQTAALRSFRGTQLAGVRIVDQDFPGEGSDPVEAEVYYELRNGLLKVAYPVFVDGTALVDVLGATVGNSGYLEDVSRRQELAKLVLKSRSMDKAIVNRMWAHFLGHAFTRPLDDMGPHNPPTHPELLDQLSDEFRKSGYSLKQLMRWITLSETYSLSSRRTTKNEKDDPLLSASPRFSHFYLRQMRAEELYASLLVAAGVRPADQDYAQYDAARREWLTQFVMALGTDDNDEAMTFNGTIPQTLMMMNGQLVSRATSAEPGSFLENVAAESRMSHADRVHRLYLAALARKPSPAEIRLANQLVAQRGGNVTQALQDVWWALLNSNEFILNH